KDAEVIVGWKKEIAEQCIHSESKLRWLQSWSAGVNNMPLDEMEKNNILLTSANGVHAYPISETIFALMLGLTRKIHSYVRNQQEKKWHHSNMKLEIHEKTIGIDRKSTRLNSSHVKISYAVFCLKKKKIKK